MNENIQNETICSQDESICFEESIREQTDNSSFLNECPEECMYMTYTTSQMTEDYGNIHKTGALFGNQWKKFISKTNLQKFPNIDEKGIISDGVRKTFADLARNVVDLKFKIPLGGPKIDLPLKSLLQQIPEKGFYFEEMIEMTTLVQINFDSPDATVITKDSKYTLFDKISSIGGTFGVFLGLSIMGIIDFILWINELIKSIKTIQNN